MEMPQIKFSEWFQWNKRTEIDNVDLPGVYILAKFKEVPKGNADTVDKNIIYVGETCKQTLKKRWYQFNNSAFRDKAGHSGGWSYESTFGDKGDDLYVAALPVELPDNLRHLFIRYIERKLILEFALKYNLQPKLNKK